MSYSLMETNTRVSEQATARLHREILRKRASKAAEFIDITSDVEAIVGRSCIREGLVLVFSRHTTAAIKINENESLLLGDMAHFMERMAPRGIDYRHNDFDTRTENMTEDECPNGHAHCQHLMLGTSEAIPLAGGEMILGRWQRIFLVELDRPREREVVIQVQGW